ncbi:MAG: hypothetical protein JNK60_01055, partial [Acidobacteria bacterium]|nr:hypothetical protein [Acidobacteriota bacterium]
MAASTRKERRAAQRERERTERVPDAAEPVQTLRVPPARIAVLVFVTFAVFANSLTGAFVYDDVKQIVGNELIQKPGRLLEAMGKDVWAFKGEK